MLRKSISLCIVFISFSTEGRAQFLPDDIIVEILAQTQAQISSSLPQHIDQNTVLSGVATFGRVFIFNYKVSADQNKHALENIKPSLHTYWCTNDSQGLWRDNNLTIVYNWAFQSGEVEKFQIDLEDC